MERIGLYAGSFDPITNGHLDVVRAAATLCDRLVIAVGVHPGKKPVFEADERQKMIREVCGPAAKKANLKIETVTFDDLVIEAAKRVGATLLIRGLRDGTDFDYEMQMAGMNAEMAPGIQTVFLPAAPATRHVTGTLVRQIAAMGGNVAPFVAPLVAEKLSVKFPKK